MTEDIANNAAAIAELQPGTTTTTTISSTTTTATKFMITTGDPQSSARKTEIVDVMSGLTCSELADFPVGTENAVGANLDGTPVICGGGDSSGYSEKCYRLKNGIWEEFASMKEKRRYAAAVMYNNKLHVFGGQSSDSSSKLKTSVIISVDGDVSDGPDLPTAVRFPAMTSINETVSILSGGCTNLNCFSAQTWYYNHDTESFTSGPDLLEGRLAHDSSTNVDKVTKAKIVVVAGGYNGNRMDSTELLINGQWQTGTIQCRKQKYFDFF